MTKYPVRALSCVVLLMIAAGFAVVPATASPIYVQPTDLNGSYASQNDSNILGNFATAYDNFTLSGSATIYSVQWVGSYFNPSIQAPITGFTVSFYADNGHSCSASVLNRRRCRQRRRNVYRLGQRLQPDLCLQHGGLVQRYGGYNVLAFDRSRPRVPPTVGMGNQHRRRWRRISMLLRKLRFCSQRSGIRA